METAAAPLPILVLHDSVDRELINAQGIAKAWLLNLQKKISDNADVSDLFFNDCVGTPPPLSLDRASLICSTGLLELCLTLSLSLNFS